MKLNKQGIIIEPGSDICEDVANVHVSSAWVLDGTSGFTESKNRHGLCHTKSDGRRYVEKWDAYLRNNISKTDQTLQVILRNGIATIAHEFVPKADNRTRIAYPSSSIAIVRFFENFLEYLVLGDCTLLISGQDGIKVISDRRVSAYDAEIVQKMRQMRTSAEETHAEIYNRVIPYLAYNRRKKNTADGYWVLEFDSSAIDQAIYHREPITSRTELMLMSDGFSQVFDLFNCFQDAAQVFEEARAHGLEAIIGKLNAVIQSDPQCTKYPRLKVKDDASAVFLAIE